jgi:peptidyl-prolyl cis-trans isomerase D
MIRFLQRDNRLTKALFVVIIAAASVSMVVYLIPGLTNSGVGSADTYAEIYPHWYSRFLHTGETVTMQRVSQEVRQQIQQRGPQYADNPIIVNFFTQQVGQQLIQEQILMTEAASLGVTATDADVIKFLHTGQTGEVIFPGGKYIGDKAYAQLVNDRLNLSVPDFESNIKHQITIHRLQDLETAGINVGDQEVRDTYRKDNIKIKFDYAVLSSDDLRKTINPSDADLEAFFKKSIGRYTSAVPEQRTITYFAFTPNQLPGGMPQPSQQDIQSYYNQHQSEYQVPEQARSRHILIKLGPDANTETTAAAKAKAEDVLKQLQAGGNWTDLAKKYSEDPGSKDSGGELGFSQRGRMVKEFDDAIFSQNPGDIKIVKSQFGFHVVQVEERQTAHAQSLAEVQDSIKATLSRQLVSQSEENFARQLAEQAAKTGLQATAAAHHLDVVTTPSLPANGTIATLPDGAQLVAKAFQGKQGDAPQYASTGEGYAIFQVTGIDKAHAPTFADWKSHVLEDYRDEQLPSLLTQKTKELADKAKAANDLNKAAKEMGATVKTSDTVGETAQVPDIGQVQSVAPQLFDLQVSNISGPITTGRTGVVAKLLAKTEPTPDDIKKNFDQTRDQILSQRRGEAFQLFVTNLTNDYKKHKRIAINAKAATPDTGQ